ncbi:MAG: helicase-related protein [Elusimicrobia bacterium]|nr:helicase-related protein [Elusimicrobiota bacterium]
MATPVIEVGIDVKNAAVMIVQDAWRFGLASLHQLRGRVGRGAQESFCILSGDVSAEKRKRIDIIAESSDGFYISEKDMQMRGPGEVLGEKQHGELELLVGDIIKDKEILDIAIADGAEMLKGDPNLLNAENKNFRQKLTELYSKKWHLVDLA